MIKVQPLSDRHIFFFALLLCKMLSVFTVGAALVQQGLQIHFRPRGLWAVQSPPAAPGGGLSRLTVAAATARW